MPFVVVLPRPEAGRGIHSGYVLIKIYPIKKLVKNICNAYIKFGYFAEIFGYMMYNFNKYKNGGVYEPD